MTITTTVTMPTVQRPANMVEWLGLITSAIKELRGEEWYLDSTFTHKDVLTAINNDKNFYTTLINLIATKLDASTYTATDILTKLKTVDGTSSGLDADYVRGYVPVNKAGDTMTNFLTLHADPTGNFHAATKQYVDNALQGFSIKKSVRALSDVSVTLSGLQSMDGVTLVAGDRVLLINQATRAENGIYDVASGAWTRSNDADGSDLKNGASVFVLEGTNYGDSGWVLTTDGPITIDTTPLEWNKFSGAGQIIPENGLYKTGNKMGLTDTGIVAGTYKSVTVDRMGRITAATNPTTLSGYGITDALNLSGGNMTGNITFNTTDGTGIVWSRNSDGASIKWYNTGDTDTNSRLEFAIGDNGDEFFSWASLAGVEAMKLMPNGVLTVKTSVTATNFIGALTGNASTSSKWATARTVTLTGDVTGSYTIDGSGNVSFATTYKDSGVTSGTYTKVTVDTKGNITSGTTLIASDIPNLDWSKITSGKPTTLSGYGITDAVNISEVVTTATANKILKLDANAKLPASITGNADGNAATASKWQTARSVTMTGDVTGSYTIDGSGNVSFATSYKDSGVTAGTYTKVTVDAKGTVTSATNMGFSDITSSLGYTPVNRAGDTMSGDLNIVSPNALLQIRSSVGANQVEGGRIRFTEDTSYQGAYIHYDGNTNVMELGVHETVDSDVTKDVVSMSIARGTGNVTFAKPVTGTSFAGPLTGNASTSSKWATARKVTLTGDVTGNFTIDGSGDVSFATAYKNSGVTAGTYTKVTVDARGIVTSATTLIASDIPNLDWSKITSGKPTTVDGYGITDAAYKVHDHPEFVKLDGTRDMTGLLKLSGDPTDPLHATTKRYVDGLIQGIKNRTSVDVATTDNITLTASQVIDTITVTSGMRVLVKNQTTASQNGIYIAKDGAWTRAPEYDEAVEFEGSVFVFVEKGTANGDTGWVLDTDAPVTIGTTSLTFTQFSRAGVTEGDNTTIVRSGNIISQKSGIVATGTYTKVTVDTYGRVTAGTTLAASDIPNLDWSKITSGKPTTLAGYGITDAAPLSHVSVLASTSTLGHVKIGNGIAVSSTDGTISADVDGTSIVLTGTAPNQKISHADTSNQASVTNTGATVIQTMALDGMGHVTSISSKTLTATDVGAIPTTDANTIATANKLLYLNSSAKLPASITGNADGNAATASKWQTARTITLNGDVTGSISLDGSADVTITTAVGDDSHEHTRLKYTDNRSVKPADTSKGFLRPYFTSLEGLTGTAGTDYQDLLVLNTYVDTAGGLVNALAFDKTEKKIRHYLANQGDTTWGTPEIIAYQSNVDTAKSEAIAASAPAGHVNVIASASVLGHVQIGDGILAGSGGVISVNTGDGISLVGTSPSKKVQANVDGSTIVLIGSSPNKQISHADTSNQSSITNTGATVIQSIGVDGMGHVTSMASKTLSYSDVGAVPTTDVVTSPTANKILKLDSNSKLPASITGDADTVDGIHANQFVRNDTVNTAEVKFNKPGTTYADPHVGGSYAAKFSGGASADKINIGGKIDLVYNSTENSLDIVFI